MPAGCEMPNELGPEAPWKLKPVATSSGFGLLHPLFSLILMETNAITRHIPATILGVMNGIFDSQETVRE